MKLRNAVTSAKKINPLQIMKDMRSPGTSSYISSAKKALMNAQEFDEDDKIEFQMSEERGVQSRQVTGKENRSNNQNIHIEPLDDSTNNALKDFVNANKFQMMEQDYNMLESPEKSHHKHSKSRSRTKEKRGNRSDGEPDNYVICPAEVFDSYEDNTCMMIDFNRSPEVKPRSPDELEETSKSLEWILSKNIDKKKRDEICRIIGEEESRNTVHTDQLGTDSQECQAQEIEVEEVKKVKFGNKLLRESEQQENETDNLGQYIDCLESVESSATKSLTQRTTADIMKDTGGVTEYMTDEILSMMLFNDIHDCPMHPIRENNFIDYFKDKYPFNRDLGIDTGIEGTSSYITDFLKYIENYHIETILTQLKTPIHIDPLKELKNLQALDDFYNDEAPESDKDSNESNSEFEAQQDNGLIIPQQLFYEFEEVRKSQLYKFYSQNILKTEFSDQEIADKIKYTFIHDKVIFDTFNNTLSLYEKRRESRRPWIKQKQAAYDRQYTSMDIMDLFNKAKKKMDEWLQIEAGTRKIPPPSPFDNFNQGNDCMNDTMSPSQMSDEERLQQLREEKLSLLLSREIQEEDSKWNEFEASEIQVKLDLADMVLETLVCEITDILNRK